jgi:hypothetical protein
VEGVIIEGSLGVAAGGNVKGTDCSVDGLSGAVSLLGTGGVVGTERSSFSCFSISDSALGVGAGARRSSSSAGGNS